ncbi:MAG TPA: hypothetical protein VMG12_32835 [Polyangiaceae bacterium]|nr:hypothetical protein [Polyangiaceae bacterium]
MTQSLHAHRASAHLFFIARRSARPALAAALLLSGAVACGSEPDPIERATLPVGHEQVLHVADVEGQHLEFVSLAPDAESAPMYSVNSTLHRGHREIVGALFEHYGPLTMLEVFNAVAPFDAAPSEIVRAHADEARAIGRANDDVLAVDLDWVEPPGAAGAPDALELTDKSLPPGSVEECQAIVFENTPQITWSRIIINPHSSPSREFSIDAYMCVAGRQDRFFEPGLDICSEGFVTNPQSRVAICHFDPASENTAIQVGGSRQGENMTYSSPKVILFQDIHISTFFPGGSPQRNAIVNFPVPGTYAYILGTGVGSTP